MKRSRTGAFVVLALLLLAVGVAGGIGLERFHLGAGGDGPSGDTRGEGGGPKILYWVAPMDPNYRRDGPGKSPMGMDLIPVYEGEGDSADGADGVVTLSPAMVQNLGVRTALAERTTLNPTIETFGVVAYDDTRTSHVHVRAEGWIERLVVRSIGAPVEQGQVVFEIFSPDLAFAAWEYVRELQRGEAQMYAGARRKLLSLGVDPRQIEEIRESRQVPDRIKVFAPRTGAVVALNVAEGMFIRPDMTTMSITDPSVVWLIADVFESQAAFVRDGITAEARIAGMPGRVWTGVVEFIYPDLRPETRTVQLRLRFDNPDLVLKPNMYASVRLVTPGRTDVLAVPEAAVIRTGRSDRVVKALGDGRFAPAPVKVGQTVGERTEILEGLAAGDRVVVSAQFLIDSESSLAAGFRQMEDAEAAPTPPLTTATGRIEAVDLAARTATVSHAPVPSLGWPAMTMDFAVDEGLDPARLAPGAEVAFDFVNAGPGVFAIVDVRPTGDGPTAPSHPSTDGHAASREPEAWTLATILGAGASAGQVNVSHEPIPALGWPAMTMDLGVDPAIAPHLPAPGGQARIGLAKGEDGLYRIVAVEPAAGGS